MYGANFLLLSCYAHKFRKFNQSNLIHWEKIEYAIRCIIFEDGSLISKLLLFSSSPACLNCQVMTHLEILLWKDMSSKFLFYFVGLSCPILSEWEESLKFIKVIRLNWPINWLRQFHLFYFSYMTWIHALMVHSESILRHFLGIKRRWILMLVIVLCFFCNIQKFSCRSFFVRGNG